MIRPKMIMGERADVVGDMAMTVVNGFGLVITDANVV